MRRQPRRLIASALTLALLCPGPAPAAVLATIDLPTASLRVLAAIEVDPCDPSKVVMRTTGIGQGRGSPDLDAVPVFHSGNSTTTVWGKGWSADVDQFININSTAGVTWQDGGGGRRVFRLANHDEVFSTATLAAPLYAAPVNTYETLTTISHSSGIPVSLLGRDPDGTNRLFTVAESTSVLRLSLLTDKNGNTVEYTRDGSGRLTHIEDVHGRYLDITYSTAGFVSQTADSGGRTAAYAHDVNGLVLTASGPSGAFSYQYDASNRMTKILYPNGGERNYAYDAQNRILTENDGSGQHANTYAYHASSTVITDALGRKTVHEFINRQGMKKPSRVIDAHGGATTFEYDANFNLSAQTDPLGRITRYEYDNKGNVTTTVDPAGGIVRASYELTFSNPTALTDPGEFDIDPLWVYIEFAGVGKRAGALL